VGVVRREFKQRPLREGAKRCSALDEVAVGTTRDSAEAPDDRPTSDSAEAHEERTRARFCGSIRGRPHMRRSHRHSVRDLRCVVLRRAGSSLALSRPTDPTTTRLGRDRTGDAAPGPNTPQPPR